MFLPAKNPGQFYSVNRAKSAKLTQAIANGRKLVSAAFPGGQIALNQVRGVRPIASQSISMPRMRSQPVRAFGATMQVPDYPSVPVCGRTAPDGPPDSWPSGMNLHYLRKSAMPYGRQLRGFGLVPDSPNYGDTWSGGDPAVSEAAQADDVAGNGIFDGAGSPPTAHAGSGVFESRFSLPGYLYREQPTQPSEIRDTTTGMPVVYQPDAGGSWYDDTRDAYRPFDVETPRLYGQRAVTAPKMLPSVRTFRTSPVSGFGEVEMPSSDTLKAALGWVALGGLTAVAITLAKKAIMGG